MLLFSAAKTRKTKKMIFLSSFHGDFRPEAIKRRREVDLFRKTRKNLSASIEKKMQWSPAGLLQTWTGQR